MTFLNSEHSIFLKFLIFVIVVVDGFDGEFPLMIDCSCSVTVVRLLIIITNLRLETSAVCITLTSHWGWVASGWWDWRVAQLRLVSQFSTDCSHGNISGLTTSQSVIDSQTIPTNNYLVVSK